MTDDATVTVDVAGADDVAGVGVAAQASGPYRPDWWIRMTKRTSWPAWADAVAVLGITAVVLSQLHPNLLFLSTTTSGGDTGAHVALPAFLKSNLLTHGQLTGWDPGWYDGFPLYTFYFPLPGIITVLLDAVFSYEVAFNRKMNVERMQLQNALLRRNLQPIEVDAIELTQP